MAHDYRAYLYDVIAAANLIKNFTTGLSYEAYCAK